MLPLGGVGKSLAESELDGNENDVDGDAEPDGLGADLERESRPEGGNRCGEGLVPGLGLGLGLWSLPLRVGLALVLLHVPNRSFGRTGLAFGEGFDEYAFEMVRVGVVSGEPRSMLSDPLDRGRCMFPTPSGLVNRALVLSRTLGLSGSRAGDRDGVFSLDRAGNPSLECNSSNIGLAWSFISLALGVVVADTVPRLTGVVPGVDRRPGLRWLSKHSAHVGRPSKSTDGVLEMSA